MGRTNPLPLYAQLKDILQAEIEHGMKPGDPLPTEPELERRFGVSRITVRRALDELVTEGLITRQQGRGTFVREVQLAQELTRLTSWSETIRQMGYRPSSTDYRVEGVQPSREIAAMLGTTLDEPVLRIHRLRYADDLPICVMTNYVREALVPDLLATGLLDDSLHATIMARGLMPVRAVDRVEARLATESEAVLLGVAPHSPLLQVTRVAHDPSGRTLYIAVVANRADRYAYTIHFSADQEPNDVVSGTAQGGATFD